MTHPEWWELVPLHETLLTCAGQHASAAYELIDGGTPREATFAAARASIHAGAAVELLTKSILAKEHPALIMRDPVDAVRANGHVLELPRTADAAHLQIALSRYLTLGAKVEAFGMGILNDRNLAAHVGLSKNSLKQNVNRLGLWIHFIQEASGLQATDWLTPAAASAQEGRYNAFILELHRKLVSARTVYDNKRRVRRKSHGDFEEWAASLERELAESAPYEIGPDFDEQQACPACSRTGHMWGVVDLRYGGLDEPAEYASVSLFFRCAVCELQLGSDETAVIFSPDWNDVSAPLTDV